MQIRQRKAIGFLTDATNQGQEVEFFIIAGKSDQTDFFLPLIPFSQHLENVGKKNDRHRVFSFVSQSNLSLSYI
jgi:hypothetical protein